MGMPKFEHLMATTHDDKPSWSVEIIKGSIVAILSGIIVWAASDFISGRTVTEHRLTAVETNVDNLQKDVSEIKQDVKEVLRNVK